MVLIRANSGYFYVRTNPLKEMETFQKLSQQFSDRNVRALSVELDTDKHGKQATTILCDDIIEIILE